MTLFNNELTDDGTGAQQDQRFILSPKGSHSLLIYTDGSLFQNLAKYNLTGKDRTALIAQAPKLKGWDARSWYIYYNEMVRTCSNNKCWLLPYMMVVDRKDINGFSIGESEYDGDCDLPMVFGNKVDAWDDALYNMISQDNILPSGEAREFVTGGGGKGYAFFQYGNRKFHVTLMDFPERVYASHPKQEGRSFEEYMNVVLFHYAMVAFKMDQKMIFDDESTQNIFISNMDDPMIIWGEVQRERHSSDTNTADKYKNGNFLNTLGQLINRLKTRRKIGRITRDRDRDRDRSSIPREIRTSNRRDSSRPFTRRSYSRDRSRSRVSGLYFGDDDSSYNDQGMTLEQQMERVNINSVRSIADFCLDEIEDFNSISQGQMSRFINAVSQVKRDLNQFDVKKHKCALCGGSGHNFDNCPEVLQGDLKSAYIRLRLLVNKLMSGLKKLYPSSTDCNDIRGTPISAINTALASSVSNDGLQGVNQLLRETNQSLREQQQTISTLNTNMYHLNNVVVNGLDFGTDSDTASTGTGTDSINSIRDFLQNFRKGEHK